MIGLVSEMSHKGSSRSFSYGCGNVKLYNALRVLVGEVQKDEVY
jgi:hypothetical protein